MSGSAGAALLEVLVALAILLASGMAAVGAAQAGVMAEHRAGALEQDVTDANRLLTALSLLARTDLDRRLGARSVGTWQVDVHRVDATLYRITVARPAGGRATTLATYVYRPIESMQ